MRMRVVVLSMLSLITGVLAGLHGRETVLATPSDFLHESQLVYSTAIRDGHDFEQMVAAIPGLQHNVTSTQLDGTVAAGDVLLYYADLFSINPLVLLSLLEIQSNLLSDANLSAAALEDVAGQQAAQLAGFESQAEWLAGSLFGDLYGTDFADTEVLIIDPSYYRQVNMPQGVSLSDSARAVQVTIARMAAGGEASTDPITVSLTEAEDREAAFLAVYGTFGDATANMWADGIAPEAAIILAGENDCGTYLLPWASGVGFHYTGGPHRFEGCSGSGAHSSVDYAPSDGTSGCHTSNLAIKPARNGTVISSSGAQVIIKHHFTNSSSFRCLWETSYYHLRNRAVSNGQSVTTGTTLGYPSCNGGQTSGTHLHFSVRWDGKYTSIDGFQLSGWTIKKTSCYNGTMKKGSKTVTADARRSSSNLIVK